MSVASDTDSGLSVDDLDFGPLDDSPGSPWDVAPDGTVRVTPEITREEPLKSGKEKLRAKASSMLERESKTGIPNLDEWMHFFSRVVIRMAMNFYIDLAFRNIDEDMLSDREIERIRMTDAERDRIARPFAELAYKNKWTRKHGRSIIASADSIDAIVQLGMWYSRVSRIAAKYRGDAPKTRRRPAAQPRMRMRPPARPQPEPQPQPQPEYMEGGEEDERTFTSAPSGHEAGWRPRIVGERLYNPDAG